MNQTPCENCRAMRCRTETADCFTIKEASRAIYGETEINETALAASKLIDNGRAGTLSRVEEVLEYCRDRGFKRIGVAYCFGLTCEARQFTALLREKGFIALPVTCTAGGVKEKEIDSRKVNKTVSCNPAGQALVMNRLKPDLVVEMGLCLGHDIIFHRQLTVPHTVLMVKDRVLAHQPGAYFSCRAGGADAFLSGIDDTFRMRTPGWLTELIATGAAVQIVDLREGPAFEAGHIKGSITIPLRQLPARYHQLDRQITTLCVCNGGIQSAYAVMYLAIKGFKEALNLSGGFSRWVKEEREVETGAGK